MTWVQDFKDVFEALLENIMFNRDAKFRYISWNAHLGMSIFTALLLTQSSLQLELMLFRSFSKHSRELPSRLPQKVSIPNLELFNHLHVARSRSTRSIISCINEERGVQIDAHGVGVRGDDAAEAAGVGATDDGAASLGWRRRVVALDGGQADGHGGQGALAGPCERCCCTEPLRHQNHGQERQVKSLDTPGRIKCCEKRALQLAELSTEWRVSLGNLSRSGKFIGFVWISLDRVHLQRRGDCCCRGKIVR